MPVADYATYCKMLDNARSHGFAYPAINIASMETASAVLRGLAEKKRRWIPIPKRSNAATKELTTVVQTA